MEQNKPQYLRYPLSDISDDCDYLAIRSLTKTGTTLSSTPNTTYGTESNNNGTIGPDPNTAVNIKGYEDYSIGRRDAALNKKVIQRTKDVIILPIPSNIQDGNSVSFVSGQLDGLTASVLGVAQKIFDNAANRDIDAGSLILGALKGTAGVFKDSAAKDYFLRNLAVSAANLPFSGNLSASQLEARQNGQIINPNMEALFDGVTLRNFKFSFKLTPRDKPESDEIKKIIRSLKEAMSPTGGGYYLQSPKIFELQYKKGPNPHPFLNRFKQCALTEMSVNYTGDGVYSTYGDGTPVSMIMDLGFKELEPVYGDDYDIKNNYGNGITEGVGY